MRIRRTPSSWKLPKRRKHVSLAFTDVLKHSLVMNLRIQSVAAFAFCFREAFHSQSLKLLKDIKIHQSFGWTAVAPVAEYLDNKETCRCYGLSCSGSKKFAIGMAVSPASLSII